MHGSIEVKGKHSIFVPDKDLKKRPYWADGCYSPDLTDRELREYGLVDYLQFELGRIDHHLPSLEIRKKQILEEIEILKKEADSLGLIIEEMKKFRDNVK